jgi:hypothetical protein
MSYVARSMGRIGPWRWQMTKRARRISWGIVSGFCGLVVGVKIARLVVPYLGYNDGLAVGIVGATLGMSLAALAVYGAMSE